MPAFTTASLFSPVAKISSSFSPNTTSTTPSETPMKVTSPTHRKEIFLMRAYFPAPTFCPTKVRAAV